MCAVERFFIGEHPPQGLLKRPVLADAKRSREARLNPKAFSSQPISLNRPMGKVVLNLFPDLEPTGVLARVEELEPGRWTGSGQIEGEPGSQFTIAVTGRSVAATVFIPTKGHFRILPVESQMHVVMEIDPTRSGLCGTCKKGIEPSLHPIAQEPTTEPIRVSLNSIPPEQPPLVSTKVSIVDLMVIYTPEALAGAGGTEAMNAFIDLATTEANTIHQNSRTTARFRLVHRGLVNYLEAPNLSTNLSRLQSTSDGFMDEIHTIRTAHQADIVCLITETSDPGIAGLAFTLTDPSSAASRSFAFAVVQRSSAVGGSYAFTHEIGHVLGCQHDRDHALDSDQKPLPGSYPFSFGFRFDANGTTYRTVMAYNPGIPIPYFSNPNLSYLGVRIGVPAGVGVTNACDNAQSISLNASLVSSFVGPAIQTFPPQVSLTSPVAGTVTGSDADLTLTASATDSDGSIRQVEFYADARILGVATSSPYTIVWTNVPAGTYHLTARAIDDLGASSVASRSVLMVRPKNDDFASPTTLAGSAPVISDSSRAGTREAGEPSHSNNAGGSSIWYIWTPTKSGSVRLSATAAGFTPLPGIYTGTALSDLVPQMKSTSFDATSALALFDAVAGTRYFIAVDGAGGGSGEFSLSLMLLEAPANDDYANRTILDGTDIELLTHNEFATTELGEPSQYSSNPGGKSIWFEWTAPRAGTVMVTCTAVGFLVLQDVYTGTSVTGLTVATDRSFTSDPARHATTLKFDATAGRSYSLVAAGLGGTSGTFAFKLVMPPTPSNDDFSNSAQLNGTSISFDSTTTYATTELGEGRHGGQVTGKSVWYTWTAPRSGPVIIKSQGVTPSFLPIADIYVGTSVSNLTTVSGRTIGLVVSNRISTVSFAAQINQTYALVIAGFSALTGDFTLAIEMPSPPVNDDFANRSPKAGALWSVDAVNLYASSEVGEPDHAGNKGGKSIWYSWTAPVSGPVTVTATGDRFVVLLDVYSGNSVSNLAPVSRTIRFPSTNFITTMTFSARYSTHYAIALDGFNGGMGTNTLVFIAPNTPPSLVTTRASFTAADFKLDVTGSAGTKFVVQASADLESWTDILAASFVTDVFHVVDTNAPKVPFRFYRALPRP